MRDLAETYLWVGELDRGLALFASLPRNHPADIWTYNVIALTFDHFGLADLGAEVTRHGLELLDVTGDPENLRNQMADSLDDLEKSEKRGREAEVNPAVLADLRAALSTDFDAGQRLPVAELCRELVPDLDQVPVKRPPEMPDLQPPRAPSEIERPGQVGPRPGRNDPCWCGSRKKYKHCHMQSDRGQRP